MYLQIFQQDSREKVSSSHSSRKGSNGSSAFSWIDILVGDKDLTHAFRKILQFCKLKIVFKISNRLSTYFSFKDKLPVALDSGVIYKYTCANCNVCYVGCTKRYWEKRLEEHTHCSALTGKKLSGCQIYAPLQHVRTEQCSPSTRVHREDFEIIGREKNRYLLEVKESIFIYKHKPTLNGNQRSVPLYLFT